MIFNITRKVHISKTTFYAASVLDRMRGMIGRRFDPFDSMVFENCNAIHTLFMSFPIDVLFVDSSNKVCKAVPSLKPWRPAVCCPGARSVIEMPEGSIARTCTQPGDYLDLRAELSKDAKEAMAKTKPPILAASVSPMNTE